MTWTPNLTADVLRLWKQGKSAAQIIAELNLPFTRSKIVGKMRRMMTEARDVTPKGGRPRLNKSLIPALPSAAPEPGVRRQSVLRPPKPTAKQQFHFGGSRIISNTYMSGGGAVPPRERPPEDERPRRKLKTLTELEPRDCRWPIGEPKDQAFGFCAKPRCEGSPYCAEHRERGHTRRSAP